ncbi:MAG: S8 family serine peptidase [Acidimicrobiia bacterium]|nr:S8 family serine peptidase [Acidimicrobiia bacterium]
MSAPVDLEGKKRVSAEAESDYRYVNKYLDQEVTFDAALDEVVTSLGPVTDEANEAAAFEAMRTNAGSNIKAINAERGFAILEVASADAAEALDADVTAAAPDANTLPVMIDGEGNRRYFLPDELTVQFAEGVSADEAEAIIGRANSTVVQKHRTDGYYTISVPEGEGLFATVRAFSERDDVEFAEPSEVGIDDALDDPLDDALDVGGDTLLDTADDPAVDTPPLDGPGSDADSTSEEFFDRLWGLHNRGQVVNGTTGRVDADIDAPQAWSIEKGNSRAVVAVIDTGADLDHPDLATRLMPQGAEDWDFADAADTVPQDSGSHGTHVAGTAVGSSNSTGVVGVAPGARLVPLRINLTAGMNANRADAINYVADLAAATPGRRYVINCSWRASGSIAAILRAIRRAVAREVLVVFAAGNDNRDMDVQPQYPGAYPEVMSVAATDQSDVRATFSNFGSTVDIAAPGVNIFSSVPNDTHGYKNGTSMASPHVAGAAALVWSRNETLSANDVRQILERSADNIDARNPGFEGKLGAGRLNAYRALRNTPAPIRQPSIVRQFDYPQLNAGSSTGLAFAPAFRYPWFRTLPAILFLTQQAGSEQVYFLNTFTGSVRYSVDPAANDTIGSLEWHDDQIWAANVTTGSGSINRIAPFGGNQIGSIPAPAGRGEGLAHDGRHLYYSTQNRIHVIDPATGAVRFSFIPPGGRCRALSIGGGKLFIGDGSTNQIRVLDARTRIEQVVYEAPGGGTRPVEGLAYDAGRRELYVANQSENRIYVIRA